MCIYTRFHFLAPDEWLETIRKCQHLPEADIKKLCEKVHKSRLKHSRSKNC
jgi:hypothetical protein